MITKCPECDLPVSDKAITCPHCGYPLQRPTQISKPRSAPKHKRLPNGFGQISKITGKNLRNPYRVMVSIGTKENGRPNSKLLQPKAYFATYNEAYEALIDYNRNPYDLDNAMTIEQLYNRWSPVYFSTLTSASASRTVTSAWAYCSAIYKLPAKDLRARHVKYCMEEGTVLRNGEYHTASPGVKTRIKSLFNMMMDYALEYELVDKNYARSFALSAELRQASETVQKPHKSFTNTELATLWTNIDMPYVDAILIQCYMGWRPQELVKITVSDVNLDENIIVGGSKTKAGINRQVPICSKIRSLVEAKYQHAIDDKSTYLFLDEKGNPLSYQQYQRRFLHVVDELDLDDSHRPHDPRKQFISMCKAMKVDTFAIKRVVGHAINDITEAVYTDRPAGWLNSEIEKISEYQYRIDKKNEEL